MPADRRALRAQAATALRVLGLALLACVLRGDAVDAQVSPGPLASPHAEYDGTLGCTKCHGGGRESVGRRCIACHREVGWSIQQNVGLHTAETRETCGSCHPDHAGRDFALIKWPDGSEKSFDHRRTGWSLEGEHADLACAKCHATKYRKAASAALSPRRNGAGWMGLERDCASCHEDVHRGALKGACVRCHDAKDWKAAPKFDHASTRYPLTGQHRDVECAKCHARTGQQGVRQASAALPARASDTVMVYRPIPFRDCASCHSDPHGGRLRGACADCHDTRSFASRNAKGFDHGRTRYPLRGGHVGVECAACHGPTSGPRHVARPAFASCGSCHTDAHAGTATIAGRRADCAACHGVEGFARASFTVVQHQRTGYPLEGAHQSVRCASCHAVTAQGRMARPAGSAAPVMLRMRPAHQACVACHTDAHGAQLGALRSGSRGATSGACESCHAVAGWQYSRYARSEHARAGLALDGRHAEIACSRCHAVDRAGLPRPANAALAGRGAVVFRTGERECSACHADVHDGRLRGDARGCGECHDARAWRPSQMAAAKHSGFAFALDGAHLATPCNACHTTLGRQPVRSTLRLARPAAAPLSLRVAGAQRCATCHTESPHGNQFATRADRGACEACHVTASFTPASRFDHDDTEFPLTGGHAGVACDRCHRPAAGKGPGARAFQYAISSSCESCHTPKQGERR